jgi:hypothetical protein
MLLKTETVSLETGTLAKLSRGIAFEAKKG